MPVVKTEVLAFFSYTRYNKTVYFLRGIRLQPEEDRMVFNMKISTKGIYAIEAMTDLAIHSGENMESIKNIATRRQLSEKYLEQIVAALRKRKLILSTRGVNGGYKLAKNAESIPYMRFWML